MASKRLLTLPSSRESYEENALHLLHLLIFEAAAFGKQQRQEEDLFCGFVLP